MVSQESLIISGWTSRKGRLPQNKTCSTPRLRSIHLGVEQLENRLVLAPIITPHYEIPNFGDYATIYSDSSGPWSNPNTWSAGRVPTSNDVVVISAGTAVTYDQATSAALDSVVIYAGGLLSFRTDMSTQLLVTNLQVLEGGELRVGTATTPIAADVSAQIVIRNVVLDSIRDPSEFGNGLIGLGKISMHGADRVSAIRLSLEPRAGQTTLTLSKPATGWRVGDKLILPDSKQWLRAGGAYSSWLETTTISAISADGKTITLTAPLQFSHPGARDGNGVLAFLPHVANRTRNIVVRSESATGTRGYVLFTSRADVDVRYTAFAGTGRTKIGATTASNPTDRFPVTFAHLYGPANGQSNGHQFTFVGNAVFCPLTNHQIKWGLGIRDSHYGLIQENVMFNWAGSGLATISGNESSNVIAKNISVGNRGYGDREGSGNPGNEGMGFWFRGPNNYVRDNVATSNFNLGDFFASYGFKYYQSHLGSIKIPIFAGADTTIAGQYVQVDGQGIPIPEFARNEVYGSENGVTLWDVNTHNNVPQNGGETVIRDCIAWHINYVGYFGYPTADVTIDGWVQRNDFSVAPHDMSAGIWQGDYMSKNMIVRNADIQGCRIGVGPGTFGGNHTLIEDSYLRNTQANVWISTIRAPGSGGPGINRQGRSTILRNLTFGNGASDGNVWMHYEPAEWEFPNLIVSDAVFVENYNSTGVNYRAYYHQQAGSFIVPQTSGNLVGSPVAGLTNQQTWDQYGIAIAGAIAPANAITVEGISGLVILYSVPPDTTSPSRPTSLTASARSSSRIDLAWAASTDNERVVGYRVYRNGVHIGNTSSTSYASTGLEAATTYIYTVVAYDSAGNTSLASIAASGTTFSLPQSDSTPPTTPMGLVATPVSPSRINLAWTPSTDDISVSGYRVYRNNTFVGITTINSFACTGLSQSTGYTFTVVAYDPTGNLSAASSPAFATTNSSPTRIIDDGDAGMRLSGSWTRATGRGYAGDVHTTSKGTGSRQSNWTFNGLPSGDYNVWVTYTVSNSNASNAPFSFYTGNGAIPGVAVNQKQAPTATADGAKWRFLRTITVNNGWAQIRLTNKANGTVVADAVRLVQISAAAPVAASPLVVQGTAPSWAALAALASSGRAAYPGQPDAVPLATTVPLPTAEPTPAAARSAAHEQVWSQPGDVAAELSVLAQATDLLTSLRLARNGRSEDSWSGIGGLDVQPDWLSLAGT